MFGPAIQRCAPFGKPVSQPVLMEQHALPLRRYSNNYYDYDHTVYLFAWSALVEIVAFGVMRHASLHGHIADLKPDAADE